MEREIKDMRSRVASLTHFLILYQPFIESPPKCNVNAAALGCLNA